MMLNRQVDLNQLLELLSGVLDEFGGLMVVDKKGCIIYTSAKFSEYFFGLGFWEARGQRVEDLLPDSGWDQVLANGLPCTGMVWNVNDQELLASWLPIIINGRLQAAVAVVGMLVFHNIEEFIALAREISGDRGKLDYYREEVKRLWGAKYSFDSIIGNSLAIVEAKRHAWDIAATRSPVLITGETGTGKELFAHAIHQDSPHREGPFIVLNCAGIPDSLLEGLFALHKPISQVCILGDDRSYVTALLVPNFDFFIDYFKARGLSFDEHALQYQNEGGKQTCIKVGLDFIEQPALKEQIAETVQQVNAELEDYELIMKYSIINRRFIVSADELTPTLKLKRKVIYKNFAGLIDKMYE